MFHQMNSTLSRSLHSRATGPVRPHAIVVRHNRSDIPAWTEGFISMANDQYSGRRRSNGQSATVTNVLGAVTRFLAQIRHRTDPFDDPNHHRNRILSLLDTSIVERLSALVVHFEHAQEFASSFTLLPTHRVLARPRRNGIGRESHWGH